MSYQLNKTNGTILTDLIDGRIDDTTTNLVLVGRNYTGYGEFFNENFIKLLENFSNTAAPSNPLTGQTWWDTADQRLKVYDGAQWKASGGPFVQSTRPQMVGGDLWIDSLNNQVYAYDGTDLILMGPSYTQTQGETGFRVESILDLQSRSRTVASLYVGGTLTVIISALEFTPVYSQRLLDLVTDQNPNGIIYKGINVIDKANFKFFGIAESANALVTTGGIVRTADSFLPSTANGITTGTLTVSNSGGLTIGASQNTVQRIVGPRFYIENQITDEDISLRVKSSSFGSVTVDGIYIDASTARVGIFNRSETGESRLPEYTLDVDGDLRVTGDLLVEGDTTTVNVSTLEVEDKNIEIGKTASPTDTTAEAGGITLKGTTDKTLNWLSATNSFTSNVNLDLLDNTFSYKINGVDKILHDRLDETIRFADGLERVGTLVNLDVDNININGTSIKSGTLIALSDPSDTPLPLNLTGTDGINILANGNIAIQDNQKITGLANPTDDQDASTKIYTDTQIAIEPIVFSLDTTGLGASQTLLDNVAIILESMYPSATLNTGKIAKIHTTSYLGATVSGIQVTVTESPNTSGVLTKSVIPVDANGSLNESVIRDINSSNTASGSVELVPTRTLMTYTSNGTSWSHTSTSTPYSF